MHKSGGLGIGSRDAKVGWKLSGNRECSDASFRVSRQSVGTLSQTPLNPAFGRTTTPASCSTLRCGSEGRLCCSAVGTCDLPRFLGFQHVWGGATEFTVPNAFLSFQPGLQPALQFDDARLNDRHFAYGLWEHPQRVLWPAMVASSPQWHHERTRSLSQQSSRSST